MPRSSMTGATLMTPGRCSTARPPAPRQRRGLPPRGEHRPDPAAADGGAGDAHGRRRGDGRGGADAAGERGDAGLRVLAAVFADLAGRLPAWRQDDRTWRWRTRPRGRHARQSAAVRWDGPRESEGSGRSEPVPCCWREWVCWEQPRSGAWSRWAFSWTTLGQCAPARRESCREGDGSRAGNSGR
jgi:hypothetical protein